VRASTSATRAKPAWVSPKPASAARNASAVIAGVHKRVGSIALGLALAERSKPQLDGSAPLVCVDFPGVHIGLIGFASQSRFEIGNGVVVVAGDGEGVAMERVEGGHRSDLCRPGLIAPADIQTLGPMVLACPAKYRDCLHFLGERATPANDNRPAPAGWASLENVR